jgi:AraC-like DNA-binding protein
MLMNSFDESKLLMHSTHDNSIATRMHMEAAWELLKEEQVKIITIAKQLGYKSHGHFSTDFKLYYKLTPSAVRHSFISAETFSTRMTLLIQAEVRRLKEQWSGGSVKV